jgi:hypothetical protein
MRRPPVPKKAAPSESIRQTVPGPSTQGSAMFLVCLLGTGFLLRGGQPSDVARFASIGVGLGMASSALMDMRFGGIRNLVRTDVMAILALYFLTLFEFLFRQETFNTLVSVSSTKAGVIACLWGFSGLVIGRHLIRMRRQPMADVMTAPVPSSWFLILFWGCMFLSYFHMLLAVDFNPLEVIRWWFEPRFSQPWSRGQLGGWKDLLNEFSLLLNLIPPLAGIMVARRHKFSLLQTASVWFGFLLTLFYGFSCGTRNVFIIFLITFLIGFAFALPPQKNIRLIVVAAVCATMIMIANTMMLQFRNIGMTDYFHGGREEINQYEHEFTVDNDLYAVCRVVEYFPGHHAYLGMELPYLAVIRVIPRAIWKNKPVGMSFTVEEVFDEEGLTIATSFVGEAYMIGGMAAVFLTGLLFGAIAGWWNQIASPKNSELGILIYASGFFATVITMRSFSVFTTTALPTVASIIGAKIIMRKRIRSLQRAGGKKMFPKRK